MAAEDALLRALLRPGDHVVIPRRRVRRHVPAGRRRCSRRGASSAPPSTSPTSTRCARRSRPTTTRGLERDADQPAAQHRRHRGGRRRRARGAAPRSSSTTPSPRPTCSSRSRSAPTSSCTRPRSTSAATPTSSAARSSPRDDELGERARVPPERDGRGAGPVRLLARAARVKTLARAHGPALRQRGARSPSMLRRHPAVGARALPRPARAPRPRRRGQADARLRRHGVVPRCRRRGRGARGRARATELFTLAESLGGVESLIEHPGRMTHASAAGSALEVPDRSCGSPSASRRRRPASRPAHGTGPPPPSEVPQSSSTVRRFQLHQHAVRGSRVDARLAARRLAPRPAPRPGPRSGCAGTTAPAERLEPVAVVRGRWFAPRNPHIRSCSAVDTSWAPRSVLLRGHGSQGCSSAPPPAPPPPRPRAPRPRPRPTPGHQRLAA